MKVVARMFCVHIYACARACVCLCLRDWNGGGKAWHGHIAAPKIEQHCLSSSVWHQHKPLKQMHTHQHPCWFYFGNCVETEEMQQTRVYFPCFSSYFFTSPLCVPSWRCFVRWWRWSRPGTWCSPITCRTTSGSSSSSSWVRCLPRTPEWRMCARPVRHQAPKQKDSF